MVVIQWACVILKWSLLQCTLIVMLVALHIECLPCSPVSTEEGGLDMPQCCMCLDRVEASIGQVLGRTKTRMWMRRKAGKLHSFKSGEGTARLSGVRSPSQLKEGTLPLRLAMSLSLLGSRVSQVDNQD